MQLQELPEGVRQGLASSAPEEDRAQALTEYSQRFVTHRLDASCLGAASSGQSSTVNAALTGGDPFQVILLFYHGTPTAGQCSTYSCKMCLRRTRGGLSAWSLEMLMCCCIPNTTVTECSGC